MLSTEGYDVRACLTRGCGDVKVVYLRAAVEEDSSYWSDSV